MSDRGDVTDGSGDGADLWRAVEAVDDAYQVRDLPAVIRLLEPLIDDPATWALVRELEDGRIARVLAYQGGISRLQHGDPEGAASWMRLVADDPDAEPSLRRGLAQVELALGKFEAVDALLGTGDLHLRRHPGRRPRRRRPAGGDAAPLDLAIATLAAAYQGDHERVVALADAATEAAGFVVDDLDQRELSGLHVFVGLALVEAGDAERAMEAAGFAQGFTVGLPSHDPLIAQGWTVAAGAYRLAGDHDRARGALDEAWDLLALDTCDRGVAEREAARLFRLQGNEVMAQHQFEQAAATFHAAGERWLAAATEREGAVDR